MQASSSESPRIRIWSFALFARSLSVAQSLERLPGVGDIIGLNPEGNSVFFSLSLAISIPSFSKYALAAQPYDFQLGTPTCRWDIFKVYPVGKKSLKDKRFSGRSPVFENR